MKGKFWRKALAAALALLIVSGSVPIQSLSQVFEDIAITASAVGTTETLGGYVFTVETDSEGDYYKVDCADALNALAAYVNAGSSSDAHECTGKRFKQTTDITLSGSFAMIGMESSGRRFNGTYDGGNFTISGLNVTYSYGAFGLFKAIDANAVLKNIRLISPSFNATVQSSNYEVIMGAVFGTCINGAYIENCHVITPSFSAVNTGERYFGAIGGEYWKKRNFTVKDCYYYNSEELSIVGGNVGTITNCARIYKITLSNGVTITDSDLNIEGTDYFKQGTEIALSHTDRTGYHLDSYTVNGSAIDGDTYTMGTADANISATFSANTYTIAFDKNNANATGTMDNQSFTYDTAQSLTENSFERTGYDFAGWNTQADGKGTPYTDGQNVQNLTAEDGETIMLYAQWTPYLYSVVFNGNSDTVTGTMGDQSFTYDVEQALNPNSYARTGYTFAGWNTEADGSGDSYANEAEVKNLTATKNDSFTLYAQWTANKYTVAFDANGGSGKMDNQSFTYDTAQSLTENNFERTGYTFKGWNTEADGSGTAYADKAEVSNLTAENNGEVTLYAQWEVNNYTVHFDVNNDNAYGEMTDQNFTYDEKQTLTDNAFGSTTGEFIKWNTKPDGSGTDYADGAEVQNLTAENGGIVTLYAQWHKMYLFDYDESAFSCYVVGKENEKYWAYPDETVQLNIIDDTYEYTIAVKGNDGTDIAFDTSTNTFIMPDQPVKITSTSVKKIDYTSILLGSYEAWDDVSYVYDENDPTVTPIITVKDGETTLTEGTDYTLSITNNTGKSDEVVTAIHSLCVRLALR